MGIFLLRPSMRYYNNGSRRQEVCRSMVSSTEIVLFEPTSVPKASVIFREPVELEVFPRHSINIVTPNMLELKAMHQAAQDNGYFEGPEWWSMLDSFKVTSQFRQGRIIF